MAVLKLQAVDAQCFQQPNPGGFTEVLLCVNRSIEGQWPRQVINEDGTLGAGSSINLDGDIIALPTMVDGAKFSEYAFPIGTCSIDSEGTGDPSFMSYNHIVDLMLAGFSKSVRKEIRKLLNAGAVVIGKMKGGETVVAGSSDDPVFLKPSFKSGKKGNEKRGYTLKGNTDGMMWDLPVIPNDLLANLPVQKV